MELCMNSVLKTGSVRESCHSVLSSMNHEHFFDTVLGEGQENPEGRGSAPREAGVRSSGGRSPGPLRIQNSCAQTCLSEAISSATWASVMLMHFQ
jgi:hypothetical protein